MREAVKSAANPKIKLAASLHQRKQREEQRLFLAEGVRLLEMAAGSGWDIAYGLYTIEAAREPRAERLLASLELRCDLYEVPDPLFRRVSETRTPQGVMLVMRMPGQPAELSSLFMRKRPLVIALDGIQDPGNAGTVIRTADAAGADGVVLLEGSVDPFSAKAVRASMGSIFHVPVVSGVSRGKLAHAAREWGIPLLAADPDPAAEPYYRRDFREAAAIVLGNEANGVSGELLAAARRVHIPMEGHAESLNVAVSAAVLLYEALRQRKAGLA